MEGIIKSLGIEEIAKEIKELIATLEGAKAGLTDFGAKVTTSLKEAGEALKEVRAAASFSELNTATKKAAQGVEGLTSAQKEYAAQQKTIETLTAKLAAMQNQEAVAVQKLRLEIAEKNRQNKIDAEAQIAATKAMNDYSSVLSKSAKSVNELREQNKELSKIVNNLNIETQADEIAKLNKVMDGNTAIIQMNKDSYTQQKMNIGNYKSALEGVTAQLQLTTDKMKAMKESAAGAPSSSGTVEQSKEYKELEATVAELTKKHTEYEAGIQKLVEQEDKHVRKLEEIKKEMTELALKGNSTWSEEETKRYNELRDEAEKLQRAIGGVNTQVKELATNNIEMRALADGFSIVTAGGQLFEEEMNALGISNESYQETLVQLQRAQATINSLETLSAKLKANSTIQIYLQTVAEKGSVGAKKAAAAAQRALNAAQKAMPIMAIIAGIALLVGWLAKYALSSSKISKEQQILNDVQGKAVDLYAENAAKIEILTARMARASKNIGEQEQVLTELNKELENSGKKFNTVQEAEQWLIAHKDEYIQALEEQAKAQAAINIYTDAYKKLLEDQSKPQEEFIGFWEKLGISMKNFNNMLSNHTAIYAEWAVAAAENQEAALAASQNTMDIALNQASQFTEQYKKLFKALGLAVPGELSNQAAKIQETLVAWNKTELQKLKEKYVAEKALLESNNQDTTLLTKKYHQDVAAINEKAAAEQQKLIEKINALRINAMRDGKEKELAALAAAEAKELAAVVGNATQRAEQVALIESAYRQKRLQAERDSEIALNDAQIAASELRLESIKQGTVEEYDERMRILTFARDNEILLAEGTGASIADIKAKYAEQSKQVMADLIESRIAQAEADAAARIRIAEEALAVEETDLLKKYQNGEITEQQYNEKIAALRHKFSIDAAQSEIDVLQKVLNAEQLTEEQRAAIQEKLYQAKKALSDEETGHILSNIEKETAARKAAADKAKELAKEAFNMAMDFLAQQSEAKIAEFDAELERIEAWKERELERLDESVMSDETRAAETKRINEKAEADRKKVEAEKRKEQEKAFRIQQATAVAQTLMNTGQAIMALWAQLPLAAPFLTGLVAAIGAAQVAMIMAQKPPKYAKGIFDDESHPGGLAIVGDAGKREYILPPSGKIFETPAIPTLIDIPKGTQVFPDYMTMLKHMTPIPSFERPETAHYEFKEMERNIVRAIENSRNVQTVQMNLDANGIWYVSNSKSGRRKFLNSEVHGVEN